MTRRFQFSLRALLVVVTAFTIWLGWVSESARRQRMAIESLAHIPHGRFYRDQVTVDEQGLLNVVEAEPVSGIRKWVADRLGIEYVADVTVLTLSQGMPDFERLSPLPLEYLSIERSYVRSTKQPVLLAEEAGDGTLIPAAGGGGPSLDRRALGSLKRMKTLRWLVLYGDVGLSDQDVSDLRRALPRCRVRVLPQPWSVAVIGT